ncbi:hypothetical protein NC652_003569 [Populus alba x Populus x berolinensis]|nr:hypothetical protein NC652_003569 [Populus alba x Populus x berolinensis]
MIKKDDAARGGTKGWRRIVRAMLSIHTIFPFLISKRRDCHQITVVEKEILIDIVLTIKMVDLGVNEFHSMRGTNGINVIDYQDI